MASQDTKSVKKRLSFSQSENSHEPVIKHKYSTHFSSKIEKSETKSHTLSPLRAALEEYAGPMPFLVVPKLYKKNK